MSEGICKKTRSIDAYAGCYDLGLAEQPLRVLNEFWQGFWIAKRVSRIVGPFANKTFGVDSQPAAVTMPPYVIVVDVSV